MATRLAPEIGYLDPTESLTDHMPVGWTLGWGLDPFIADVTGGAKEEAPPIELAEASASEGLPPRRGVLVVAMGDDHRGDGSIALHLIDCLRHFDWPGDVAFCRADESVPRRAEEFAHVVMLDAMEGPDGPGALYQADPAELLSRSTAQSDKPMGMLGMLSPAVRKRLAIFALHPRTSAWGSQLSEDVLAALPVILPYIRAFVLQALGNVGVIN